MHPSPLPSTFIRKKAKILHNLSIPDSEYNDKSPKGSVDEGIRELIREINAYEGFVTTSSCAGRISVFLEGQGTIRNEAGDAGDNVKSFSVSGGKGGGKFLFVSHDPVDISEDDSSLSLSKILHRGMRSNGTRSGSGSPVWEPEQRLVRFAFEPMILHIMTASLHHAKPLLSAAINSGFRESGVQSLKNLDDPEACPMVAVRTAGLGLEAVIASIAGNNDDGSGHVRQLVPEEYMSMLLKMANERFVANSQRINRFQRCLREAMTLEAKKLHELDEWEGKEARRRRKQEEGLKKKEKGNAAGTRDIQSINHIFGEVDEGYPPLHLNN